MQGSPTTILRGQTLSFRDDPFKVEPDAVTVICREGGGVIPLILLPPNLPEAECFSRLAVNHFS